MNNVFRLIWNRTLGRLVVTSEAARSRDKSATRQGLVGQLPAPQTSSSISALLRPAVVAVALAAGSLMLVAPEARADALMNANTCANNGFNNTRIGIGTNAEACEDGAVSIGWNSSAVGRINGGGTTQQGTSLGQTATSSGGVAIGFRANSVVPNGIATAIGAGSQATGNFSIAIGTHDHQRTTATADGAIALGSWAKSTALNAVAIGRQSEANSGRAVALGHKASAGGASDGSVAIGADSVSSGGGSVSVGLNSNSGSTAIELIAVPLPADVLQRGIAIGMNADGVGSVAIGHDAYAGLAAGTGNAGRVGTAVGAGTRAEGHRSIAIGTARNRVTTATGTQAIAMGNALEAEGVNAIAIGNSAAPQADGTWLETTRHSANGNRSISLGFSSQANSDDAIAVGSRAAAINANAIAIGRNAQAESRFSPTGTGLPAEFLMGSVALGDGAKALSGTAVGANAGIVGTDATGTAIGGGATAGNGSIALSGAEFRPASALGLSSIAAGSNAQTTAVSTSAIALGSTTAVDGKHSIAMGRQSEVSGERSMALGQDAKVGTYDTNGDATGSANSAIALGDFANVQGNNGIAIGKESLASVENTIAMGAGAQASGLDAIAMGTGAKASGEQSISIGYGNEVSGDHSGAVGDPNIISGTGSYALGNDNTIEADNAGAFGNNNTLTATAAGSRIIGNDNNLDVADAFVMGNGADVTVAGGVALGNGAIADTGAGIPGYNPLTAAADGLDAGIAATQSTTGAVAVGDATGGVFRQITGVAAGSEDSDAVNVAQLKASETHYYSVNDDGTQQANFNNDGASGVNALAAGTNASASGESAVAVGDGADAGSSTISAGALTGVTNPNGYAVGDNLASTAVGAGAKVVSGTAIGFDAVAGKDVGGATVNTGTAIGGGAQATGNASIAISPAAYAPAIAEGDTSIAQGLDARSPGSGSVAIGALTSAAADGGIALGASAAVDAAANSGIALGNSANVTATNGMALGASSKANADAGIALGTSATVDSTATNGIALGLSSNVTAVNGVALGAGSAATVESGVAGYVPTGATVADSTNIAGTVAALGAVDIGSRQITSVAAGTQLDDAVNVAQLVAVENIANTGWDVQVNAETADNVAPGETVQFIDGKNIEISRNADQVIEVATADEVEFTQVTIGDATNNTVITSTVDGLDVGGDKITNVQAGDLSATSTDAVNGSQLFATNENVTTNTTNITNNAAEIDKGINFGDGATSNKYALGDTINVNGDANVTSTTTADGVQLGLADVLSVGSTNPVSIDGDAGTISGLTNTTFDPNATYTGGQAATQEQLTSVSNVANAGWDVQVNAETADNVAPGETVQFIDGKNIEISRNADQVIEVATADEVEFTQVTIGDVTNNTVITSTVDGLDVGGDKITNVQAGDLSATSTDAVNGSQLFATNENVTTNTTNITNNAAEIDKGINFGDGATSNKYALGDTINVNGDSNVTSITTADGVQLGLADVLSVGSTNPVSIDGDAGTISGLTNTTFDPNATYTGGQAATQEQLTSVSNVANAGWDVQVNAETADNVAPGETVQFIDGKNIEISRNADQVIEVATADEVEFTQVTIGDATNNTVITSTVDGLDVGGDKITNVQAGDLSATSTDAVNGSQLFATNENVTTNTTNITNNAAEIDKGINFGDGATSNKYALGDTINVNGDSNVTSITTADGVQLGLADVLSVGSTNPVSIDGDAGTISGLTNTTFDPNATYTGGQAATQEQLTSVSNVANAGWDVQVNAETADNVAPGETVQFIDGKNIEISRNADQVIEVATADEVEFTQVTIGDVTNNTVITSTVDGLDVGGDKITNVQAGDLSATSTDAVNGSQLFATNENVTTNTTNITNNAAEIDKGINFGDGATSNKYALGDTINVNGDANVTSTTTADGVQLGLADVLSVGSTNPVSIDGDAGTISGLTNTTFDPNATYTGGQAATQEQLTSVSNVANAGWNVQANGDTATNVAPNATVQFIDGQNIDITRTGTDITVATSPDLTADSLTINGGPVINSTGINMGGNTITNVGPGVAGTDAVNVNQLEAQKIRYYSVNDNGVVQGNYNNDGATGLNALAAGVDAKASLAGAMAVGHNAHASGFNSVAVGTDTQAIFITDVAIGNAAYAAGGGALNLGAVAVGNLAYVSSNGGIAIGHNARVTNGNRGLAIGVDASSQGNRSMAMGLSASANGTGTTAIGDSAMATGDFSVALGGQATAQNTISVAGQATNVNAVAMGGRASGVAATSLGRNSRAMADNATAVGGGGAVADAANATSVRATAIGYGSLASGVDSIAIGDATSSAADSIAMGRSAQSAGLQSIAIGYDAIATGSVAMGASARAGNGGAAFGDGAVATYNGGVNDPAIVAGAALGENASADVSGATALGTNTTVTNESSVALGQGSIADGSTLATAAYVPTGTTTVAAPTATSEVSIGSAGNERRITNVAAGATDTDAVNVSQLKAVNELANSGWSLQANTELTSENIGPGESAIFAEGKNINVSRDANKITVATEDEVEFTQVTIGDATNNTIITSTVDGLDVGGDKITNVQAGDLSATSTDAVNGSQLFATNTNVTNNTTEINKGLNFGDGATSNNYALGDTINVNGDANVTSTTTADGVQLGLANVLSVGSTNPVTINGDTGTISGLTNTTFDPNATYTGGQAATQEQLTSVSNVANAGWNVQTNGDTATNVAPNATVQFIDGQNIDITRTGTDITVATSPDLTADSLTINGGPVINNTGINMGGNTITNLAPGVAGTDAVNVNQLAAQRIRYYSVNDNGTQQGNFNNDGATGVNALAAGTNALAAGNSATAVGNNNSASANNATAVGTGNTAEGERSVALGFNNNTNSQSQIAIGANNVLGAGTPGDSFTAIAIGRENKLQAQNTTVIGQLNEVSGRFSSAFGFTNNISGENSTAFGIRNQVEGRTSVAMGFENKVTGGGFSRAIGYQNEVSGKLSTALGGQNTVSGNLSSVIGAVNNIDQDNAFVLGNFADVSVEGGVAIGTASNANTGAGISGYNPLTGIADDNDPAITATKSTYGAVAVGDEGIGLYRQVTGVAAGTADSDAVNVAQLKALNNVVDQGFNITADNADLADPAATEDTVKLGETVAYTSDDGNIITTVRDNEIDFALNTDLTIGGPGAPGEPGVDGTLGVDGADGVSGVAINGADGSIGLTGPAGQNGISPQTILRPQILPGDVMADATDVTRLTFEDGDGNNKTVATLEDDGLRFSGNDNTGTTAGYVTRNLNDELQIVGTGADTDAAGDPIAYSSGNVKTVATQAGGIEIQFADTPNFQGADMGDKQITSVESGLTGTTLETATGDDLTNAVNVGDLQNANNALVNTGFNITADNADLADPAATEDTVALGETVAYTSDDGNIITTVRDNEIDFALNTDLTIGGPGAPGEPGVDGTLGVDGADGVSGVAINGADGSIGLTGPAGQNGISPQTILRPQILPGDVMADATDVTRLTFEDGDGNNKTVATLEDDGLRFSGNDNTGTADGYVTRNLNDELQIVGTGADTDAAGDPIAYSSSNVKTVATQAGGIEIQFADTPNFQGADMGDKQITSVESGLTGTTLETATGDDLTNAVNVGDLQNANNTLVTTGFNITADNADLADPAATEDTVALGETVAYTSDDGNIITTVRDNEIDFALNTDLTIGGPGAPGEPGVDGTLGVDGADGVSGVAINGADGSIGLTGPAGQNGISPQTILRPQILPGDVMADATDVTRLTFEDGDGNNKTVATLEDDGLRFSGNDNTGTADGYVTRNLNDELQIVGTGADTDAAGAPIAYSSGNVKTVATQAGGIEIQFADTPNFQGADMGDKQITSVESGLTGTTLETATGDDLTNAVNVGDLQNANNTLVNTGFNITADNTDLADPAATEDTVALGETVAYTSDDGNIITTVRDNEIDFALNTDLTIGGPGAPGEPGVDGTLGVDGADGVSGVAINGADGSIGLTGPAGQNGISPQTILRPQILPGDVVADATDVTRLTFEDGDGNNKTVATLEDDGLRFSGNDNTGTTAGYVTRNLNDELQIVGTGADTDAAGDPIAYSSGNVKTVATQAGGIEIQFADTPNFQGADMGDKQITSVESGLTGTTLETATGDDLTNAVNVGDLQNANNALVNTGFNITADNADLADPAATEDTVALGETVAYNSDDGNIITTVRDNEIDFALNTDLTIGGPGAPGEPGVDGTLGVDGADGVSGVAINGADGSIGLTGPAGQKASAHKPSCVRRSYRATSWPTPLT
ncbi:hypothetical protein M0220_10885 [Halomonas qinghailakensis]|uniref:Autotransporter adhesin n=2 Tax=Halomonas TaxID=2745 RepID=A0AA46TN28_9GAMM|nr:ESPR-type extended signal peptide-containing protein [Halomonas sp. ZZQ-149]UYO73395.1 hypothetical protein M0220_10885 [Halomonas sp. ZZQ-149]